MTLKVCHPMARMIALLPSGIVLLLTLPAAGQTVDLTEGESHQVQLDGRKRLGLEMTTVGYKDHGEFLTKPVDLGRARSIRIDWIEQWTAPQTWKRHAGNPIFGPKQTGPWDGWTNGVSIIRMADGKTYRMF